MPQEGPDAQPALESYWPDNVLALAPPSEEVVYEPSEGDDQEVAGPGNLWKPAPPCVLPEEEGPPPRPSPYKSESVALA